MKINHFDEWIPNLFLLLSNRKKQKIFLFSNNSTRLIASQNLGFCILPVVNSIQSRSFELQLLEKFIINMRNNEDGRLMNMQYFNYLTYSPKVYKIIKNMPHAPDEEKAEVVRMESNMTFRKGTGNFNSSLINVEAFINKVGNKKNCIKQGIGKMNSRSHQCYSNGIIVENIMDPGKKKASSYHCFEKQLL